MTCQNNSSTFMATGHTAIADFYNDAIADILRGAGRIVDGVWRVFEKAQYRTRMVRHVEEMPEYLLRDIGVERQELMREIKDHRAASRHAARIGDEVTMQEVKN